MASTPRDLDGFLSLLLTSDTKMRLSIGSKLYTYLNDPCNSIECSDIGQVIDCMVTWLQSSNFRVVYLALDILIEFIDRMKYDFQTYLPGILSHIIDRLGDSKELIREKTLFLLMKIMECNAITPQNLFDRIAVNAFNHKNSNVREHVCNFLISTLDEHSASSLSISKLIPHIVKLLSDPNAAVRCTAFNTLVDIYKHVGEKLRIDLQKKYQIPQNKLSALMKSFDDAKDSGDMLCSIFNNNNNQIAAEDEVDKCIKKFRTLSATSRPPITPLRTISVSSCSKIPKSPSLKKGAVTTAAGAVDEDSFLSAFHDVVHIQIFTGRDVEEVLKKAKEIIENANQDWSKRVEYLKKIRSLILNGGLEYDEFYSNLNSLLSAFQVAVKDLRSQVVRESCITLGFLSQKLGWKFDHFAETLLCNLINLIQNSARVIASSGLLCIKFILQYTHAARLIPTICSNLNSKSKEIRRACCEFISFILQSWEYNIIEKYVSNIQEAIKKGVMDADGDARMYSRKAFSEFQNHFPEQAEIILATVDNNYRKQLICCNSNSGSTSSLPKATITSPRRSIQVRSNSAIDANAAKRANARAQYAALGRQKVGWNSSLPRSNKKPDQLERSGRSKTRTSISQPNSRSASPSSSRLSYSSIGEWVNHPIRRRSADRDTSPDLMWKSQDSPSWEPTLKDISEIIANCESTHWNSRKEGLLNLQHYIESGNRLGRNELKKCMDILTKIFNDPHIKVFSLFLDSLNELIISHKEELNFSLYLLLTRLFNKLGGDLLSSIHSKIHKTLDVVCMSFSPDLQLQCVFRFLVDPTQTPNLKVKSAALNYIIKLTTIADPCLAFPSNLDKDYATAAIQKMIGWIMDDSVKQSAEFRKLSQEAVIALFKLNTPQVTERFSKMPKEHQEAAAMLIKNMYQNIISEDKETASYDSGISQMSSCIVEDHNKNGNSVAATSSIEMREEYIKKLMEDINTNDCSLEGRKILLLNLKEILTEASSELIIISFKQLLRIILSLISDQHSTIREAALGLLQTMIKKKPVSFCFKDFIELVILKVLTATRDACKEVMKAADSCAISISIDLPAESVIKVIVPLITSEDYPVNLVAIKMLTKLVEHSPCTVTGYVPKIMSGLLAAYDNTDSVVRKSAVFAIVALHKELGEDVVTPYYSNLSGAKIKLLQLYISRSQQGSSGPISPRCNQ